MNDINSVVEDAELDFSLEFSGDELKLIQRLKLGDVEKDEQLRNDFVAWYDRGQAECRKDESVKANIKLLMKKAKLLFMAGLEGEAWRDLFDARTLASNVGDNETVEEANKILLKIAAGDQD